MALRDELLSPIAGANPGGVELRYDPIFDKIKEARREDIDVPQGEWATAIKTADWPLVIKLSKDALATRSKDLQIAVWLAEALLQKEGFAGFAQALDAVTGLIEQQWDHLYPEIEDGDLEMRAGPLEWLGGDKLVVAVRMVPLDGTGHGLLQIRDGRLLPTEAAAAEDDGKAAVRNAAIAAGKPTPEDLDAAFTATPKVWFKGLVLDIDACLENLRRLDAVAGDRFGNVAPNFSTLRSALEEVQRSASSQLRKKLEIEPDPVGATPGVGAPAVTLPQGAGLPGPARGAGPLAPEPTSREDAAARVVGAARYLRANDPFNPAAYLILRGFRWGELRANSGGNPNPKLLEAPPTHVRTNLKGLLLDSRWPELLEAAELVMGSPQGRGWLDLQRYTLTACDGLGSDYFAVATAMRGALRALLSDLPQLLDMTLMDDTPAANAETRAWLAAEILPAAAEFSGAGEVAASPEESGDPRTRDPVALAAAEVRAGRADRAIALLMREAGREKTSRGRFLVQAQLAKIMVDAGHEAVAIPILEQLISAVEMHKLEEWEAGEVVAAPMALMYRVLEKTDGDPSARQALYLRICRLDPIQAISFTQA